jgi:PAS domain S-box-containing protein
MALDATADESREMLKAIVDATTAVIYIKDVAGRYVLINRRFEELFHVSNEAARGKTDHGLFPKNTADRFRANDLDVQHAKNAVEFEERVPHDDGEHIYISIKFPLVRETGEVYAVCGISTDITERKRAEEELAAAKASLERLVDERTRELREANERLKAEVVERQGAVEHLQRLIDTAREGIWVVDETGKTTFANTRLAEMLGYTVDEMIGRTFYDFMDDDFKEDAERQLERRRRGIAEELDWKFRSSDGRAIWALVATNPILKRNGTVAGALAVLTDITERKRAEEHQTLLLRELDHRVKNTLATVLALSDLTLENVSAIPEFRETFTGRVQAMARTHEALSRARWKDVMFDELVAVVLAPLASVDATRVQAKGDSIRLSAMAMTPLALALNELATNALKHGALSRSGGGVEISWSVAGDGELQLDWLEHGGPRVRPDATHGTGVRLIRGLIEHELGGQVKIDLSETGLRCRIAIPRASVAATGD